MTEIQSGAESWLMVAATPTLAMMAPTTAFSAAARCAHRSWIRGVRLLVTPLSSGFKSASRRSKRGVWREASCAGESRLLKSVRLASRDGSHEMQRGVRQPQRGSV
jgi:hypothetical protein